MFTKIILSLIASFDIKISNSDLKSKYTVKKKNVYALKMINHFNYSVHIVAPEFIVKNIPCKLVYSYFCRIDREYLLIPFFL